MEILSSEGLIDAEEIKQCSFWNHDMKACRKIIQYLLIGLAVNISVAWILSLSVDMSTYRTNSQTAWGEVAPNSQYAYDFATRYTVYGFWHVEVFRGRGSMQVHSFQCLSDCGHEGPAPMSPLELFPQSFGFDEPFLFYVSNDPTKPRSKSIESIKRIYEARGWPFLSVCCLVSHTEFGLNIGVKDKMPRRYMSWNKTPRQYLSWKGGMVVSRNGWPYLSTEHDVGTPASLPKTLPLKPILGGFVANTLFYGVIAAIVATMTRRLRHWYLRRSSRCIACGYILSGITSSRCPECGNSE